ncbi:MAG: prepilin-type N-terminal cleavage/methylation domain-containing protein [Actinomycetota bacterium]
MKKGRAKGLAARHGFTLVELMITILILAILVTIVVMTMSISKTKAQQATCKANLRTLFDSIAQYQCIWTGTYPENMDLLLDGYLKNTFNFTCPAGDYDYRTYYDSVTGHTSCPRAEHNP